MHKIGEKWDGSKPAIFQLVIDEHVPFVDPKKLGLEAESINPRMYFVTSGDAVEKARVMERDFWDLAGRLRRRCIDRMTEEHPNEDVQQLYRDGVRPTEPKGLAEYESAVWRAAGLARRLVNNLIIAKGEDCFLETEWDDHALLCIPKNPRNRDDK